MFNLVRLNGVDIFTQLQLEEALLRADEGNWCIINTGSPDAIVMGISGEPSKLIDFSKIEERPVPVIKRFSGGGTVYIDPKTILVTFISNSENCQPKKILEWSESIYRPFFGPSFSLRENDYVFGDRKFGGNAQYMRKNRFLHHTSFLWDVNPAHMAYLLLPEKRPAYRASRSHLDFLTPLSAHYSCPEKFICSLEEHLKNILEADKYNLNLSDFLLKPHRKATIKIC